jgi:hypothetical protein
MFSWLTLRLDRHLMHAGRGDRRFGFGSLIWLTVVVCALGTACSESASTGGSTAEGGAVGPTGEGAKNGAGGAIAEDAGIILLDGSSASGGFTGSGAGGVSGVGGSTASGAAGAAVGGAGGAKGTGGSVGTGLGGTTGAGGATGTGGKASGAGGTPSGAGGTPSGAGGARGTGGVTGTGGLTGTGGAMTSAFCPSGAIFCADFEEASGVPSGDPVGTATFEDPNESGATFGGGAAVMDLDANDGPFDGNQSLRIDPSSAVSVRTLVVAVPATFWVRLYIKSDLAIGQPDHNSFFGAGTGPVYSTGNYVELSEQYGCVLLNKSGILYPTGTSCGADNVLPANSWHCLTAEFDGTTGNVRVFSGATQIINAAAWAPATEAFNSFSFGYFAYNPNGATVWYDDVVISASPLSCP